MTIIVVFLYSLINDSILEGCYYCDGETDCSAALPRNHTLEACPGLGTTHVCKVSKIHVQLCIQMN